MQYMSYQTLLERGKHIRCAENNTVLGHNKKKNNKTKVKQTEKPKALIDDNMKLSLCQRVPAKCPLLNENDTGEVKKQISPFQIIVLNTQPWIYHRKSLCHFMSHRSACWYHRPWMLTQHVLRLKKLKRHCLHLRAFVRVYVTILLPTS